MIDSEVQTFKHKKLDILKLPIKRTFENIELDPALAASVVPTEVRTDGSGSVGQPHMKWGIFSSSQSAAISILLKVYEN